MVALAYSPAASRHTAAKLVWTRPAEDLWVATISAKYAGSVRKSDDTFLVTDQSGRRVGESGSLTAAMNALSRADHLSARGVIRSDPLGQAAIAIGLFTLALAVVAVPVYFR